MLRDLEIQNWEIKQLRNLEKSSGIKSDKEIFIVIYVGIKTVQE